MLAPLNVNDLKALLQNPQYEWPKSSETLIAIDKTVLAQACRETLLFIKQARENKKREEEEETKRIEVLKEENREKWEQDYYVQWAKEQNETFWGKVRTFFGKPWTPEKAEEYARTHPRRPTPQPEKSYWETRLQRNWEESRRPIFFREEGRVLDLQRVAQTPGVTEVRLTLSDYKCLLVIPIAPLDNTLHGGSEPTCEECLIDPCECPFEPRCPNG